jgi:diguanylate cyclase (GGDEF)-like protein
MADQFPPNGSGDSANGASEDQLGAGDSARRGSLETEQTLADTAQTLSDTDQTGSDSDQTSADEDQIASDHDQAASDRDYTHGGDPEVHRVTREIRARSTMRRDQSAQERVEAAAARDAVAHARDLAALARDRAAALRDRELAARDATTMGTESAEKLLRRVVADRAAAADSRARAAADREQAARDREQASRDRAQGRADRDVLLSHLTTAETDTLTGARNRSAGLHELEIEIGRARRMDGALAVAHVDIVALKTVSDAGGRAAGDALLQGVVNAVREQLRAYDLVVRLGGHEFLCALSGVTEANLRTRFAAVQTALAAGDEPCRIEAGFAALGPDDTAADLIERAGADR